jgi:hypothetical protein
MLQISKGSDVKNFFISEAFHNRDSQRKTIYDFHTKLQFVFDVNFLDKNYCYM